MKVVERVGSLDPCFAWRPRDQQLLAANELIDCWPLPPDTRGAFAACDVRDSQLYAVRDPLGIAKLFWADDGHGRLLVGSLPKRLVDAGVAFRDVRAIPPGHGLARPDAPEEPTSRAWVPSDIRDDEQLSVERAGATIRERLDGFLAAVARSRPSTRFYVCMSGGLDSTGIASLARLHLRDVVGVSFDLARPDGRASEDRRTAERLAQDLQLPLLTVDVTTEQLLAPIDEVIAACADWRDFNVHCGLVSWALGEGIRAHFDADDGAPEQAVVLTGDLANEYLADYHEETYAGRTFYRLPRIEGAALRDALVRGIDTSHRELGPFGVLGLECLQPYAAAADPYLSLEPDAFDDEARKAVLDRAIFAGDIPDYVYQRKKSRAQVGDAETGGGVLAACVDAGMDDAWLKQRFAELHEVEDPTELNRFMRAGRYRAGVPSILGDRAESAGGPRIPRKDDT